MILTILILLQGLIFDFVEYINLIPSTRVVIDYGTLSPRKESVLILYALPNGNSIEWTAGKKIDEGDDWHFDIQHIKAQTDFVRQTDTTKNYIVAYLESATKGWTTHAAKYTNSIDLYGKLTDTLISIVEDSLVLQLSSLYMISHSGGGRFMFNYLLNKNISAKLRRLSFIDSNYGFEDSLHTPILLDWLENNSDNKLSVISYVDTTVVLNGKRIVSSKGGTGYKLEEMYSNLRDCYPSPIYREADTSFVRINSADGKLLMLKKENPTGKIYHTILVERNGFIHSILWGTPFENKGYQFWGERAYIVE